MSTTGTLRLLIADDHEMVRRGLRSLLEPRCEVCGEATNGREEPNAYRKRFAAHITLDQASPASVP